MRTLQLILIIAVFAILIAVLRAFVFERQPDVSEPLARTQSRLDAVEQALDAYVADHLLYPPAVQWMTALSLTSPEVADPFAIPADSRSLRYWSDSRWYTLSSAGPDAAKWPAMSDYSVVSSETIASTSTFAAHLLGNRTPQEMQALLGDREVFGDIRWRSAFYDPTNGMLSAGDIVRFGGPAPGLPVEREAPVALSPLATTEFEATPTISSEEMAQIQARLVSLEAQASAEAERQAAIQASLEAQASAEAAATSAEM